MTKLIYNESAYITEFNATVLSCVPCNYNGDSHFDIILDATAFFPEQGGQSCDNGYFTDSLGNRIDVIHVKIIDNIIHHITNLEVENNVVLQGHIDFESRFDKMQQHSAEHLISGTVHRLFGYDNVGFHLGDDETTLDFNGIFEDSDIKKIEKIVNNAVFKNIETKIYYPSDEELNALDYRSKKELSGQVRIVEFPEYDICACCAPHIQFTGEIGLVKIISAEHFRQGTRMVIKAGSRALNDYSLRYESCIAISRLLSVRADEVVNAVNKLSEDFHESGFKYKELEKKYLSLLAKDALSEFNPVIFTDIALSDNCRFVVNEMTTKSKGYCACFCGSDYAGYRFVIGSSVLDCNQLLVSMRLSFNIKGGGTREMIQGTINAEKGNILNFFRKEV